MSKGKSEKVEKVAKVGAGNEALIEEAKSLGVKVDALLRAGLLEEAREKIEREKTLAKAKEAALIVGRSANRFALFYRKIGESLKAGRLPSGVEDREYTFGILGLYPKEGRGGGVSDWANKGASKGNALFAEIVRTGNAEAFLKAYDKVRTGEATEGVKTGIDYLKGFAPEIRKALGFAPESK